MACENEYEENAENLRKLFCLNNIVSFKIRHVKCTAGSSSGDNYMSVVKRIQISGTEHDTNKEPQNLTVIVKRQIPSLSRRQLYRCDEAFCNEINAYTHVVPLLEQYTASEDATTGAVFPKCFYAGKDDLGEIIVLQDLKELGYCMENRLAGLELSYCELVMKQLAKLHAASIAAKQMDHEIFHEKCKHIREIVYCKEAEEFYKNILDTSMQESLNSLRASNGDGCLTEPIRLIEKLQTKLFQHVQACITNSKEQINVLCHGDLWVNNIMFSSSASAPSASPAPSTATGTPESMTFIEANSRKTSSESSKPHGVKFFDLQAMRYTSPVFDLLHFIYTSTKRDLREAYTKTLLETYCRALKDNLEQQLAPHGPHTQWETLRDTFSLRNITAEYYDHVLYGLAISMWILPAVTFDPNNIPNLDVISEMNTSAKEIKCTQKLTPEYHSRMKDLALEFYQNGYLTSELANEED